MAEEHDGSAYLASLKRGVGGAASARSAPARTSGTAVQEAAPTAPPAGTARRSGAEKRRSPRYKCEGSAEIRAEGSDARTWAACTDISMHGCYVEAAAVYPPDTMVLLKIEAQNLRIQAEGSVRVSYPGLGMGVAFTKIAEDDRTRLKEMLRNIALPSVIMGTAASASNPSDPVPNILDPAAALKALIEFFDARQMLTRGEFVRILYKSQESGNGAHQ
jgi:hypothetical protein